MRILAKIYVGNLPWSATEDEIRDYFSSFGSVESVTIITDRNTGRSRGFGFVEMDGDAANDAISRADGKEMGGRTLRVSEARERSRPSGPPRH